MQTVLSRHIVNDLAELRKAVEDLEMQARFTNTTPHAPETVHLRKLELILVEETLIDGSKVLNVVTREI